MRQKIERWGFIDTSGNWIVPAVHEEVRCFSDGLAAAKSKGRWGFIRPDGTWAVSPTFDEVKPFTEGLAAVKVIRDILSGVNLGSDHDCWGYIDTNGGFAIAPRYSKAGAFSGGLACVEIYGYVLCGKTNSAAWGYIDKEGVFEIQPQFTGFCAARDFSEGLAFAERAGKLLCFDRRGTVIFELPEHYYPHGFSEGLVLCDIADSGSRATYAFYTKNGKQAFGRTFSDAWSFENGLALVRIKGPRSKMVYIDHNGTVQIEFGAKKRCASRVFLKYKWVGSFCDNIAIVQDFTELWGAIDRAGRLVLEPRFELLCWHGDGRIAAMSSKGDARE